MILDFEYLRDGDALTREEGELLYALVRSTKPLNCVETGTHKGLSSHYIAQALKDNDRGHLITCDPVDWKQFDMRDSSPLKDWFTFQQVRGVDSLVEDKIDFLFIDGYHGKKDVIEEIEYFFPMLSENAIVMFHDCDNNEISNTTMVNAAIFEKGLKTTFIKTQNRMRIYEHSNF